MKKIVFIKAMILIIILTACRKSFLDKKPDKALVIPTVLEDFEAILNNEGVFIVNHLSLFLLSTDEICFTDNQFKSLGLEAEKNHYIWARDLNGTERSADWFFPYRMVFYSNVALGGLKEIEQTEENHTKWNEIKGKALFFRSSAFFSLASQFAAQYEANTAKNMLGIPLRLTSDVNDRPGRGTLEETYSQIVNDLIEATILLPNSTVRKSEPDKAAAWGMLARVYLTMDLYEKANEAAESALTINDFLLDYKTLVATNSKPFPPSFPTYENQEVLQQFHGGPLSIMNNSYHVNPEVYELYSDNDLRKNLFFQEDKDGSYYFKGTYVGNILVFQGLTTAEMFLIKSECNARLGNLDEAVKDLTLLHSKRYKLGQIPEVSVSNEFEILELVIEERRKELLLRGLRWTDLRRLNKEKRFEVTLRRTVNDVEYQLLPNSPRYILQIPIREIELNDKVEQNVR